MVFFDVRDNLNQDAGVSQVRFGAGQEILETELNELQTLFDLKLAKLISATMGNAYVNGSVTVENGNLVISEGFLFVGGRVAQIDRAETPLRPDSRYVLRIYERMVDGQDSLRGFGNRGGENVPNHIVDPRYNQPLSRRMTWDWRLETIPIDEVINQSGHIDVLNPLASDVATTATPTVTVATSVSDVTTVEGIDVNHNEVISKVTLLQFKKQLEERLEKHGRNIQELVDAAVSGNVPGIKMENGRLMVLDGENWQIISTAEDLENRFAEILTLMNGHMVRTMPIAPPDTIHAAIGGRWEELHDVEKRAVTMATVDVRFELDGDSALTIPEEDFNNVESFNLTTHEANVSFDKQPFAQVHHAVGEGGKVLRFEYDGHARRISWEEVER